MVKVSRKDLIKLVLPALVIGAMLIGGCVGKKVPAQIIKDITPQEASALIQENQDNPDFVIIDVQTPDKFTQEHIENAINLDYYSENFRDELDKLDKDKTYLIYCRNGSQSRSALEMMAELNFKEVYNISGGLDQWKEVGLATIQIPAQISESITPQEAFALIHGNKNNPDFIIIDVQTPDKFAQEHIENAINLDYGSQGFQDELDKLDRDKTYLIYCQNGAQSQSALDMMAELNFKEVYNISGGLDQWKAVGLATIKQIKIISESITAQEAFDLIQENQDNPNFIIIDIRTPEAFAQEHIENAINLDYGSQGFQDELDKDKTYLIYCQNGSQSQSALDMMAELNFTEVYDISGGLDQWKAVGLPTIQIPSQISESITAQEAFDLIQENQDNPNFVIIDIETPEEFAQGHIENAINITYGSENFQDELDKLDKDKIYLIYYSCACGNIDKKALDLMKELGFKEVYKISDGLDNWKAAGLPTIQEPPAQISESISAQEALNLIQENQDNPDFVIIDIRSPGEFDQWHVEDAINIDYHAENFREELDKLDKDKTYLIHYSCACGNIDKKALDLMKELGFKEVYKISGGLDQEKWEELQP